MKEMGEGKKQDLKRYDSSQGVTEHLMALQNARFGKDSIANCTVHEIDLLGDEAGPEFLTEQDVRTLLGIPRSDRWSVEG